MLKINPDRCPQNHRCPLIRLCPKVAISQEGVGLPSIDNDSCIKCMKCVKSCPMGAVEECL